MFTLLLLLTVLACLSALGAVRVAGADPGTSSLDWLILEDGAVADQCRFTPDELRADAELPCRWLQERGPFQVVAAPSGYGLPLLAAKDCGDAELALLTLVRPDDRGHEQGVVKFTALLRGLIDCNLPLVFLPAVIHLPTVPALRKVNRIDLGTADKLCVAALALRQFATAQSAEWGRCTFCVVELGSAFSACVVVQDGQIVDGVGGSSGPVGWAGLGAWDGELAHLCGCLSKDDLFGGGVLSHRNQDEGRAVFRESLVKNVAALRAVTPFQHLLLSGRLLETEPTFAGLVATDLGRFGSVAPLESLPGVWVKHAAQGAAVLADGLAGGPYRGLIEQLALRGAQGTVLDWLRHPRAAEVRAAFGLS